jgi:hypothetical protein
MKTDERDGLLALLYLIAIMLPLLAILTIALEFVR